MRLSGLSMVLLAMTPVLGQQLEFEHVFIDREGPSNPWAKIVADLDGDGFQDIAIGGQKGPLVWYRFPTWSRSLVTEGGYDTVDGEAGDIDADGDLDLVLGGLFWYENPGPGSGESGWKAHQIADHPTHDVEIVDLDADGDLDVVTRDQSAFSDPRGNEVHLWFQQSGSWNHLILSCRHGEGLRVVDLDSDGDPDIILDGSWFENVHNPADRSGWTLRNITQWHHSASVAVGDLNRDGRPDVVLTPSELKGETFRISWFEAPPAGHEGWVEHVIESPVETVYHSLQVGDMDLDGDLDIATAEMHQGGDPDQVVVYLNQSAGSSWEKHLVSTRGSHSLQLSDLDADGDLDLVGANWSGPDQPVELWLNLLRNAKD